MADTNGKFNSDKKDNTSQVSVKTEKLSEQAVSGGTENVRKAIGSGGRLQSLDFYRGLIMVLLMMESSGIFSYLEKLSVGSRLQPIAEFLFSHAKWHGLHFWDLIQPGFMFVAGAAMAFSLYKQTARGISWNEQHCHAWRRSGWLFFWGVLDYAVAGDHLVFELWDVLTQLSFTLLVAFYIFRWKTSRQLILCAALLLLTEFLYRYTGIEGFSAPFTDQHNFGNFIDLVLMDKTSPGGWVAINCLPTAVHTILGAVVGKWLLTVSNYKIWMKRAMMLGLFLLLFGYFLDGSGMTPIIKRIATTSFTLVSGGWCLLALIGMFWWIDIRGHKRWLRFFTIVGMNSIFIYLFFEIVVGDWLYNYSQVLIGGLLSLISAPAMLGSLIASLALFIFQWGLCWWLYKKKIFFKV